MTVLPLGVSVQMSATAFLNDGSKLDISQLAEWTTSDALLSTISSNGSLTTLAPGTHDVTASYKTFSTQTRLTIEDNTLVALNINPTNLLIAKNTSTALTVMGILSNGAVQDVSDQVTWQVSDDAILSLNSHSTVSGVDIGKANLIATLGELTQSTPVHVIAGTLTQLQIQFTNEPIITGDTIPIKAIGTYAEGYTQDLTSQVTWDVPQSTVLSFDSSTFTAQAISQGDATISADFDGTQASQTFVVTQTNAQLMRLEIVSDSALYVVNETLRFQATGFYSDNTNKNLTQSVSWSSDNSSLIKISNNLDFEGYALALQTGTTVIHAEVNAIQSSIPVTISPATLLRIEISREQPIIQLGTSHRLTATGIYSDNSTKNISHLVTWRSLDESTLHVSNEDNNRGMITALETGSTQISATIGDTESNLTFTVEKATLISVSIEGSESIVHQGETATYRAIGIYSNGEKQDISHLVTWNSSVPGIMQPINDSQKIGAFQLVSSGNANISVSYQNIPSTRFITVLESTLKRIIVSNPSSSSIPAGYTTPLKATAIYSDNTTADITALAQWQSDDSTTLRVANTTAAKGIITALTAGQTQVQATYLGLTGTIDIMTTQATLTAIEISPQNIQIEKDTSVLFSATGIYSDNISRDITAQVIWLSADPSVAFISNSQEQRGLLTAIALGETIISATVDDLSTHLSVTINDDTLEGISIFFEGESTLASGSEKTLSMNGNYSNGALQDLSLQATWQSANTVICSVFTNEDRIITMMTHAAGLCTISARFADLSTRTFFTITESQLTSISIEPSELTIPNGGETQLQATGHYADNSSQDISSQVTWSSSSANIQINQMGYLLSLSEGAGTITADLFGVSKNASITVTSALLESITISPSEITINEKLTKQLSASGLYSDGSTQDITRQVLWSSSNPATLTVSNYNQTTGLASAIAAGDSSVTASLDDISQTTNVTVKLIPTAPKSIAVSASPYVIFNNGTDTASINLKVSAIDDASTIPDNTVINLSVLNGSATLSHDTALSSDGAASFTLQSTTKGIIRIKASIEGTDINNIVSVYSTDNFAEVIAIGTLTSATVTGNIVQTGSKFGLMILNYANRPFNVLSFMIGTKSEVIYATSAPERLNDNVLSPGKYIFNGWETEKEQENSFLSLYFLSEPLTGVTFPVGVFHTPPSNN